tara:strand:+ start:2048 stop:7273 length:5226 start_codon:yes stop_codon:yes gene_type:complete
MAQVGRISGPVLQANLERNGIDLAFRNTTSDTQLLYFNVSSGKLGVNKGTTGYDLDVAGTTRSTNLLSNINSIANLTIENSTFSALVGDINLNADEAIVMASMENGTIRINDNIISTIETNANIDITPNGSGTTEIVNNLTTFGNIHSSGNISFDGTITLGDNATDEVIFNTDVNSDIISNANNTYNLGSSEKRWDYLYTNLINGTSVVTQEFILGGVNINLRVGGKLYVAQNGDDSNKGDHPLSPFATISRALQAAEASGEQPTTIEVYPGEYQEALPLIVPSNVTVLGQDIRNTIITPDTSSQSNDVFHLNDNSTISDLTIRNFYYDSINNTGYAFRFAPNTVMSTRSPYIQNITVLTNETSEGVGDAGRGAWIDGDELNAATVNKTMLFHSCTFISPNADVINMTNDVRVEWLNSFTYFANRGLYAFNGSNGGAELRSIGSANVYGNYGAVADGADTLMYLIQHNFGYIGAGNKSDNNEEDVIQANEIVELNSGQIHFVSTDQLGNFRVGDSFFVDLENGNTSINIDTSNIQSLSGLVINTDSQSSTIDGTNIDTGNINFASNRIASTVGNLNLDSVTGITDLNNNSTISGSLSIRDDFSFGGTLNLAGDQSSSDRLVFNVAFEQNFNPHQNLKFNLGETQRYWSTAHLDRIELANIVINDNYIETTDSNSPLELRANGTGEILIPSNNVQVDNNLTVSTNTNLQSVTNINTLTHLGNRIHTGDNLLSGELTVDNVYVEDNFITTVAGDLNLQATGDINIDTNDVEIANNLTISGTTDLQILNVNGLLIHIGNRDQTGDTTVTGNVTITQDLDVSGGVQFEEILVDDNFITTTTSNADLELRANGTGKVVIPSNNVNIDNDLSVNDIFGNHIEIISQPTFSEATLSNIIITQNYITTNTGNLDLELRANATGIINVKDNFISNNDITINGNTFLQDSSTTYEYGPELINNGTFDINLNGWAQAGGGSATDVGGNLQINALGAARNVSQEIEVEIGKPYEFKAVFRSVSNSNPFYLRIFESGVGTLFEQNESSGLTPDQLLTTTFTPQTTAIDIIFRAVDTVVEWDDVSTVEDIGLVTTYDPVQVDINGTVTQTGTVTQIGNVTQTGDTAILGNVTVSNEITTSNFNINDNVIQNYREDLRLNPANPYDPSALPQIIRDMINDGATASNYVEQTDKNLVNFLANGTNVPYANSFVDVNLSGTTTSADALAWLQYVANGSAPDATQNKFIFDVVELLLEDEFANPGKYNSNIFLGDYYRADLVLKANSSGRVSAPTNDVRVTNNLFTSSIIASDINVSQDLDLNEIVITDSIIEIDDNFISTTISNANLELQAERNVIIPNNDVLLSSNLTVSGNTDIDNIAITGNIAQTGNRNQLGNLNVVGTVTVSTSNIKSEIQFDDIIFNDNYIETTQSNADLELRANGTGNILVPDNDLSIINDISLGSLTATDINVENALNSETLELSSNIILFDNVITTTNSNSNLELRSLDSNIRAENLYIRNNEIINLTDDITLSVTGNLIINATGALKLPIGSTTQQQLSSNNIRFNSTDSIFEAFNNSKVISFNGIYSDNRGTSVLTHPTSNTINFTIDNDLVGSIDTNSFNIHGLGVDDVLIQGNTIRTNVSNSDLDLVANGSGVLELYNANITGDTLENTSNSAYAFNSIRYGKVKFTDTAGITIPAGTDAERPSFAAEEGLTRWNTTSTVLETWDGNTFVSAAGNAATISESEMDDLILEYTLIFG